VACDDGPVTAASSPHVGVPEISRDELLRSLRENSITLVDVLSPESFAATHIPGAISLPVLDIARRASTMLPDRRARIVVYCGGPT
jgi:rhodanese-related sulfurtransferase